MPNTLGVAQWLRNRGFSVIPLDHPDDTQQSDSRRVGKVPLTKWEMFQSALATDANLRSWFANGHQRNLGIVTGAISGVIAVDCDSPEALAWAQAHLPPTPMRTITANGEHWYYRHPGAGIEISNRVRLRTGDPAIKLDVRGDGGYCVGPTSKHATGTIYERGGDWPPVEQLPVFDPSWLDIEDKVATAPKSPETTRPLAMVPDVTDDHEHVLRRARRYVDAVPPAVEGSGGDAATYQLACRLVRGFDLSDVDALDVMRDWNARCVPPWREDELLKKLEGARKYGDEPIGARRDAPRPIPFPQITRTTSTVAGATPIHFQSPSFVTPMFALTDTGNAEYFAQMYGEHLRYDHRRGRWLVWDGARWKPDADGEVRRLAKSAIRRRLTEATSLTDDANREKAVRHALASENRARLDAMIFLAQSESPIADDGTRWDDDDWLLCTPTGVVELRNGQLRPGRPSDRITLSTTVGYDPSATCPRWERFIADVFAHDAALIQFVHRAIGYSLSGDTSQQVLFLGHGVGSNGKGTLLNTVRATLGDYGWNMPFSTVEMNQRSAIPNDLAALVNRRFVVASETNDGVRLNEARVKALTGCDPVTARFLHGEYFEFEPNGKYWLVTNHKPVVRDDSHGFWRRIRLIPFTQTFAVDPHLADALRAESAGILSWAVRGCLDWQRYGLDPPACVVAATAEYQADSDPLRGFIDEGCELVANAEVGATDLFDCYRAWADRHGLADRERLTSTMFGRKVAERFQKDRDTRTGRVIYRGLARRLGDG